MNDRRISLVISVLVSVILISGCHGENGSEQSPELTVKLFFDGLNSIECLPGDDTLSDELVFSNLDEVYKQHTTQTDAPRDFGTFLFACAYFENMEYVLESKSEDCAIVEYSGDAVYILEDGRQSTPLEVLGDTLYLVVVKRADEWRIDLELRSCE